MDWSTQEGPTPALKSMNHITAIDTAKNCIPGTVEKVLKQHLEDCKVLQALVEVLCTTQCEED